MAYKYNPLLKSGLQEMPAASYSYEYPVGYYTTFTDGVSETTTGTLSANIVYGVPIVVNGTVIVESMLMKIDAGAVGSAILGIMKYDRNNNQWVSFAQVNGVINTNTVAVHQVLFSSPVTLEVGEIYLFCAHSSVAIPTIRFITTPPTRSIFGYRSTDFADLDMVYFATAYTGTLPVTMAMSLISFGAPIVPQLLAKIV